MAKSNFKDNKGSHTVSTKNNGTRLTSNKYTHHSDGKHEHKSSTVDYSKKTTREYYGGENSKDRSYNQTKTDKTKKNTSKSLWDILFD